LIAKIITGLRFSQIDCLFDNNIRVTWICSDTRNNVCHVGHQHPKVIQAIQKQVQTLNTNTRYLHPNMVLLAQRIANLLPDPLQVVFLVNSGSEANDLALRLARAYSGGCKNTIVIDRAYHGHTLAVMEVSPYKYEATRELKLVSNGPSQLTPGSHIWKVPCPDVYRGLHQDPTTAGVLYANYVQEACRIYQEERGEQVSAWIVESGMSVAGVILPPPAYLATAVSHIRLAGGLYIADEVQTGFGRFGECFWGFQYQNDDVIPDIVTMAKPMGNGMPLAAVVTTRAVASAFEETAPEYFNTYGGNPVCAAAGLAVLDVIESENLQRNAKEVGDYLKSRFLSLKERLSIIGDVRGCGLFLGVELIRNPQTKEPAPEETSLLCTLLKEKYHVLTSIDGPHDNVIVIKPPLVFSKSDADEFIHAFEMAVTKDLAMASEVSTMKRTPT
jgi:ethanolamine-phosphate phospho-lyase